MHSRGSAFLKTGITFARFWKDSSYKRLINEFGDWNNDSLGIFFEKFSWNTV